ncbi:MAG: nucleotidyl transferase AbiEii/AbiGii toxin family protein [Bacteroidales bacterium]|nr:nucleotidyl transferase AbiEii/AbiGii toxin family protein [Bacteroidales bacterium]
MIDNKTLDIEWINEVSAKNRKADKILVEKVIRALYLLEGLAKVNLDFVFKGGTALMLLMDSSKRLSIDIDIILYDEPEDLEKLFNEIISQQSFTKFELQERNTESKIKKAHYKFYYNPIHKTHSEEEYILLDILYEKSNYQNIIELPINSKFLILNDKEVAVQVPSHEDILGDKLTAFAPNTTGIPYFKSDHSMSMEIMKQLYDIASLVDVVDNMDIVNETFKVFSKTELVYREKDDLNYDDVLEDIIQTSLCIVSRGVAGTGDFTELQAGIQRVSRFIFSEPFHLEIAITLASKAAYIAIAIRYNKDEIEKFSNPIQMKEWTIVDPLWPRLNRLKKSNPEAFFYWFKIHALIQENNG